MAYLSLVAAPCLDDFTILRRLGDGSSGTVHLVRENDTGGLYALKAIPKRKTFGKELRVENVMTERNTLLELRGDDFILQLRACFHDSMNYYLVTVRDAILKGMNVESFVLIIYPRNIILLGISTLCYCRKARREMWFGSTWQSWYVLIYRGRPYSFAEHRLLAHCHRTHPCEENRT